MTVLSRSKNAAARVTSHDCKWIGSDAGGSRAPSTPVRVIHSFGPVLALSARSLVGSAPCPPPAAPPALSARPLVVSCRRRTPRRPAPAARRGRGRARAGHRRAGPAPGIPRRAAGPRRRRRADRRRPARAAAPAGRRRRGAPASSRPPSGRRRSRWVPSGSRCCPATSRGCSRGASAAVRSPVERGWLVAVGGSCGGAGASTVATALALAAAPGVLLVDADPWGGGLDLLLGAERADGLRWPDLTGLRGRVAGDALLAALPEVRRRARAGLVAGGARSGARRGAGGGRRGRPVGRAARSSSICARAGPPDAAAVLADADLAVLVVPGRLRAATAARLLVEEPGLAVVGGAARRRDGCPGGLGAGGGRRRRRPARARRPAARPRCRAAGRTRRAARGRRTVAAGHRGPPGPHRGAGRGRAASRGRRAVTASRCWTGSAPGSPWTTRCRRARRWPRSSARRPAACSGTTTSSLAVRDGRRRARRRRPAGGAPAGARRHRRPGERARRGLGRPRRRPRARTAVRFPDDDAVRRLAVRLAGLGRAAAGRRGALGGRRPARRDPAARGAAAGVGQRHLPVAAGAAPLRALPRRPGRPGHAARRAAAALLRADRPAAAGLPRHRRDGVGEDHPAVRAAGGGRPGGPDRAVRGRGGTRPRAPARRPAAHPSARTSRGSGR